MKSHADALFAGNLNIGCRLDRAAEEKGQGGRIQMSKQVKKSIFLKKKRKEKQAGRQGKESKCQSRFN